MCAQGRQREKVGIRRAKSCLGANLFKVGEIWGKEGATLS